MKETVEQFFGYGNLAIVGIDDPQSLGIEKDVRVESDAVQESIPRIQLVARPMPHRSRCNTRPMPL